MNSSSVLFFSDLATQECSAGSHFTIAQDLLMALNSCLNLRSELADQLVETRLKVTVIEGEIAAVGTCCQKLMLDFIKVNPITVPNFFFFTAKPVFSPIVPFCIFIVPFSNFNGAIGFENILVRFDFAAFTDDFRVQILPKTLIERCCRRLEVGK